MHAVAPIPSTKQERCRRQQFWIVFVNKALEWLLSENNEMFFLFLSLFFDFSQIRQRVAWSSGLEECAPRDLLWRCFFRKITMNFHSAWSASWTTICLCTSKIQPKSKLMQKYSKLQHLFAKRKGFHRFSRFEIDRKYLELQRAPLVFRGDIPNISKGYSKCGRCAVQLFCICSLVTPAQLRSVPKFS